MRFVFGIVVGVLLAVGGAYVHDAALDPARDPQAQTQVLVNWTAVSETVKGVNGWLHEQVGWLSQQLKRVG